MLKTRKVVINTCYGGFGLSEAAVKHYADLKKFTVWPVCDDKFGLVTYWLVPPAEQDSKKYGELTLSENNIPRDDPELVLTIEQLTTLGINPCGKFAELQIVEIPDDIEWDLEEYDGTEWIAERHRKWP